MLTMVRLHFLPPSMHSTNKYDSPKKLFRIAQTPHPVTLMGDVWLVIALALGSEALSLMDLPYYLPLFVAE